MAVEGSCWLGWTDWGRRAGREGAGQRTTTPRSMPPFTASRQAQSGTCTVVTCRSGSRRHGRALSRDCFRETAASRHREDAPGCICRPRGCGTLLQALRRAGNRRAEQARGLRSSAAATLPPACANANCQRAAAPLLHVNHRVSEAQVYLFFSCGEDEAEVAAWLAPLGLVRMQPRGPGWRSSSCSAPLLLSQHCVRHQV